ncbi:MAG: C40 family peptidase [Lachnospiraceae bacterium]|nr:C40 family peptidase [Lachnospiraceae bacterium]
MRIKRTDRDFTVRQKAGRKIHYAGQGKKYTDSTANFSPKEKQDSLRQKNLPGAGTGIQGQSNAIRGTGNFRSDDKVESYQQEHGEQPAGNGQQIQRPSAYHENTIKTKEPVLHRKADTLSGIKGADGFRLKDRKGKKEKVQESDNILPAACYAQSFSDKRDSQISKYKRKKFLQSGKEKYSHRKAGRENAGSKADTGKSTGTSKIPVAYQLEAPPQMQGAGESALPQMKNNLPADNTNTGHIRKRSAGDSIRQRDGDIPGRRDETCRNGKKSRKDKGKDKDAKKDNSYGNRKNRKDRAAAFRMLSYASDKFSQEEQKDSLLKVVKDLLAGRVKAAASGALLSIGAALLPVLLPAFIIVLIITLLFNSPFSILLPKLTEDPGAVEVLTEYTDDFRERVQEELADLGSSDETELIYEDYEGDGEPDNMADILMVYMVKHGFGDTATVMTEKNRRLLKDTFDEMTSMSITYRTEIVEQSYEEEDFYGNVTIRTEEVEITIKEVRITLLTSEDIIRTGIFTEEETEILRYLMSPEILENIEGLTGGYGSSGAGSLTPEEAEHLNLGGDVGSQAVKNALARLGKPYSQAKRDSGDYYDCSSLTYYSYKEAGITLSYHGSNTAASQGQLLSERGCEVAYEDIQPGDLIFYSFTRNGRYRNISHVAVYAGNGYLVDASSSKGYVVFRPVYSTGKIVMCGRPSWL